MMYWHTLAKFDIRPGMLLIFNIVAATTTSKIVLFGAK